MLPESDPPELASLLRKLQLVALRRLLVDTSNPALRLGRAERDLGRLVTNWVREDRSVADAFGELDVLVPLLARESGALDAQAALALAGPPLLLELSQRQSVRETFVWDSPVAVLVNQRCGWSFELSPPALGMSLTSAGLELRLADGSLLPWARFVERGTDPPKLFPIDESRAAVCLSIVDTNPLSAHEAHPDKSGNAISLGGRTAESWCQTLRDALALIAATLPRLHREMSWSLRRIIPVGFEPEQHLSASYREAPGLCYLTLHPDLVTMAEAMIHESQHGKLNALTFFDPVLENGYAEWTQSPVRPDLRPLMGVLLAVHAFVPVAAFHQRLAASDHPLSRSAEFRRRRAEVLESNARGLQTLRDKAKPTSLGARLLDELSAVQAGSAR